MSKKKVGFTLKRGDKFSGLSVFKLKKDSKNYSLFLMKEPNIAIKLATFNSDQSVIEFKQILTAMLKAK